MPSYRYEPIRGPCRLCGAGFDCMQGGNEPAHTECPKCGLEVRRVAPDSVSSPRILAPLSVSAARNAGFTVLKRTSDGNWEKQ